MMLATAPTIHRAATTRSTEQLLRARNELPADHPDRGRLRAQAIEGMLPLANRLARRYSGRGECVDDLAQVAALALIKAIDGYDLERLAPFVSYAIPTIVGALKRHFRDTAWDMRVPRAAQELVLQLRNATDDLEQLRGRTPTPVELAGYLHVDIGKLREAVCASRVYRVNSLDASVAGSGDDTRLVELTGRTDPRFTGIDEALSHRVLDRLVAALPLRQRRILTMRFADEMTQASIGADLGISQMHVSRLLRQSLNQIKIGFLASAETAEAEGRRRVTVVARDPGGRPDPRHPLERRRS